MLQKYNVENEIKAIVADFLQSKVPFTGGDIATELKNNGINVFYPKITKFLTCQLNSIAEELKCDYKTEIITDDVYYRDVLYLPEDSTIAEYFGENAQNMCISNIDGQYMTLACKPGSNKRTVAFKNLSPVVRSINRQKFVNDENFLKQFVDVFGKQINFGDFVLVAVYNSMENSKVFLRKGIVSNMFEKGGKPRIQCVHIDDEIQDVKRHTYDYDNRFYVLDKNPHGTNAKYCSIFEDLSYEIVNAYVASQQSKM